MALRGYCAVSAGGRARAASEITLSEVSAAVSSELHLPPELEAVVGPSVHISNFLASYKAFCLAPPPGGREVFDELRSGAVPKLGIDRQYRCQICTPTTLSANQRNTPRRSQSARPLAAAEQSRGKVHRF